jgi:hypothetical protein
MVLGFKHRSNIIRERRRIPVIRLALWLGGNDAAHERRHLVATQPRAVGQRKFERCFEDWDLQMVIYERAAGN